MSKEKAFSPRAPVIPMILCGAAALLFTLEGILRSPGHYDFWFVGNGRTFGLLNLRVFGMRIYDVMMILGAIAAYCTIWSRRGVYGLTDRQALTYPLILLLIGGMGSYIYMAIQKRTLFVHNLSMIGGLYALALFVGPVSKHILRQDLWEMNHLFLLMGMSFAIVARTGCFLNGCCGGAPMTINGHTVRLPVQLYEVFCLLAIQTLMFALERHKIHRGVIAMAFIPCYALCRFLLECLRGYPRAYWGLTETQVLLIIWVVVSAIVYARSRTLQKPGRLFPLRKG